MKNWEIAPGVYYVGVNDRCKTKFEELWPLPYGVSYNAYLLVDEKCVLVDTVDAAFTDRLLARLDEILIGRDLDYLIINHMEPDHSAAIQYIRQRFPQITIVGNAKTLDMVKGYYGIDSNTLCVRDGDSISIGQRRLSFCLTPMVHWPETMMTFCPEGRMLFSGDAFGCFGALNGGITDQEMNTHLYWDEMTRYYANIVGKYGSAVQSALKKLSALPIETICPTHGPVWRNEVSRVISTYDRLSRYEAEEGVVIAYGSMYGHTEQMAETIARELSINGIRHIVMHSVAHDDPSFILQNLFRYQALIVGSPTYSNGLFPPVESLLQAIATRDIRNRVFACFGSYTWAGNAVKRLMDFAEKMEWECVAPPVEMRQNISPEIQAQCRRLAQNVANRFMEHRPQ